MPNYTLPHFNLVMDLWTTGHTPATFPPDQVDLPLQLYVPSRGVPVWDQGLDVAWHFPIILRCPSYTVLAVNDIIQITPAADYFRLKWVQRVHQGFLNEYKEAVVLQCDANGTSPRP